MTVKEIGQMIRNRRLAREMSQYDLAKATGLSQSAITMYERGERRPNDEAAEALADAFNVPKWAIYYREDEISVPKDPDPEPPQRRKWRMLSAGALNLPDEQLDKLYAMAHVLCPDDFPLEEDEEERKDEK